MSSSKYSSRESRSVLSIFYLTIFGLHGRKKAIDRMIFENDIEGMLKCQNLNMEATTKVFSLAQQTIVMLMVSGHLLFFGKLIEGDDNAKFLDIMIAHIADGNNRLVIDGTALSMIDESGMATMAAYSYRRCGGWWVF